MKLKHLMLAALIALPAPAFARDGFHERGLIGDVFAGVGALLDVPVDAYDAAESFVPYHHRFPVLHGVVRGALGLPREAFGVAEMVTRSALVHGVPPALAHGIVRVESNYNCRAYNRSGASGIMQVLPGTARAMGVHGSLRSCANGLEAGMRYLRLAYLRAHGDFGHAAAFYNGGLAAARRYTGYSRMVLARLS